MFWTALRTGISAALDALQLACDAVDAGKKLYRKLVPRAQEPATNPLPHRDVERIAAFGRHAGHENEKP